MRTSRLVDRPRVQGSTFVPPIRTSKGRAGAAAFVSVCVVKLLILSYLAVTATGGLALGARLSLVLAVAGGAICALVWSIARLANGELWLRRP